jgi:hypothetical protein
VSACQADGVWRASAATARSEPPRGGMGFSRGSDCARAMSIQVSNQTDEIVSSGRAQMFLRFIFPPYADSFFWSKRDRWPVNWEAKTLENISSRFDGLQCGGGRHYPFRRAELSMCRKFHLRARRLHPLGIRCIRTKVCRESPQHAGVILGGLQQSEMRRSLPNFLDRRRPAHWPAVKPQ